MIKTTVPAGGLHNEEDLQIGKQGKVLVPFHPLGNTPCGRERQGYGKFTLRYACAGFQRLFSRNTVSHATHGWRFGECASGKGNKNAGSRWTTRKAKECTLLGYSLLGGISLPKSLPVLLPTVYR
ncbi:hypothetical protein NXX42_18425 [Bacteroides thetaiotaomicron]|nr:hypothetical protein [Bacteroides thetaiotaomicron]